MGVDPLTYGCLTPVARILSEDVRRGYLVWHVANIPGVLPERLSITTAATAPGYAPGAGEWLPSTVYHTYIGYMALQMVFDSFLYECPECAVPYTIQLRTDSGGIIVQTHIIRDCPAP
jgi:hypothetical protein